MPLYAFKCKANHHKFDKFLPMEQHNQKVKCPKCGSEGVKLLSNFSIITDTNFGYTGKVDKRLGDRPIEGRADWHKRVKEKGLVPLTQHELKNM